MKPALLFAAACFLVLSTHSLSAQSFVNPALKASNPPLQNARVDGLDTDQNSISITDCALLKSDQDKRPICEGATFNLTIKDQALKTKLKNIHLDDHIRIDFDPATKEVREIGGIAAPHISTSFRVGVLFTCAILPLLLAAALTAGRPLRLIIGMDNRYSNSKLQAALWFWVMLTSYLEFFYCRVAVGGLDFLGHIDIPQNLLLLSGISAITFAGAKGITTAKANAAANAKANDVVQIAAAVQAAANPQPAEVAVAANNQGAVAAVVAPAAPPAVPVVTAPRAKLMAKPGDEDFWSDIVKDDLGGFDFGDFQMVIVTLLAVGTYLVSVHHALGHLQLTTNATLPDLDTTILSAFGLGQGAYLAKKAVGNPSAS